MNGQSKYNEMSRTGFQPVLPTPASLLAIVAIYALLGWLGLALAIPPGYASPVFPASGFALAVTLHYGIRVLPAIWIGSLLLNIVVALMHGNLSATPLIAAAGIATGALLQSWAGQLLIHKWLNAEIHDLDQEKEMFRFLVTGGLWLA